MDYAYYMDKQFRIRHLVDWYEISPAPGHYYLYGIRQPDASEYVYIGITRVPIIRYNAHQHAQYGNRCLRGKCGCAHGEITTPFSDWWKAVRSTGSRPRMDIIADLGPDAAIADLCERHVLIEMQRRNVPLFNKRYWDA